MNERARAVVWQVAEAVAVVLAVRVAVSSYPTLESATRSTWNTARNRWSEARRRVELERTVRRERLSVEFEAFYATREAAEHAGE